MTQNMKKIGLLLAFISVSFLSIGQILQPITWSFSQQKKEGNIINLQFKASIDDGWHVYGQNLPSGGPVATSFHFDKITGAHLSGDVTSVSPIIRQYDQSFSMTLTWYVHQAVFNQKVIVTDPQKFFVSGYVEFMGCNDENCLPPAKIPFSFGKESSPITEPAKVKSISTPIHEVAPAIVQTIQPVKTDSVHTSKTTAVTESAQSTWAPVITQLDAFSNSKNNEDTHDPLWLIFLKGLLGGLIALFTPCVWPIIPLTVSFFLKRSDNKTKAKRDAGLYGFSIIAIYLILGILITLIFGASALNSLSTNAYFNLFFFALLVLFAASFLGAFELTLPASWTTKLDNKAESTSGFVSILLMAFTLALVSFSCTGPIIGTLLVDVAVNGSYLGPAIGMFGFALALAVPFMLFAMFPMWLKSMPKSGGWLNSVKVVLGFLELALSLKFFSVADLAYGWRLLDREVFLVLWIVIFALLGFYLLGKIKFAHDSDLKHVSVVRLLLSIITFAFALYMIPGLWGAPLKAISAFAPPLYTQDFNLNPQSQHTVYNDYDQALEAAATQHKPLLIDFTGYGCVNCRKMEAAVWTDPKVKQLMSEQFIVASLYVDDKTTLKQPMEVTENGHTSLLSTIGDKWSYLQRSKFGANAQPFYVIVDAKGIPLTGSFSFTENPARFAAFLEGALRKGSH
ncbi:thiol:disulfide interchange protein DsbD [Microbacter margulisiae]|uniref:Thiol:disulfide interchange protein DsbD n=2 Tax=Microbacter margulisiae TaxID=1350067 RepID=A0A7W5H2N6_9PORP|nr:cytochrome c biogenesis protein CcdA [Microbacter margulisiae]MBB3187955.1 thiol:disulfide interchange protein DsbD [Microbacter margulisiae]